MKLFNNELTCLAPNAYRTEDARMSFAEETSRLRRVCGAFIIASDRDYSVQFNGNSEE
jgi:hypothetical protein